tara:strand:- start:20023 stop:20835 length:813 start_codon:yes stop_codon:yes gene_type:complete
MTVELAKTIVDNLILLKEKKWNPRLEFAMHGEPTLNPDFDEIVSLFKTTGLPMLLTTNGSAVLKRNIRPFNVVAIDCYEHSRKIWEPIVESYKGKPHLWYPDDGAEANPHRRREFWEHDIIFTRDISVTTKGTHSVLNNHCGSAGPLNSKAEGKRCAKPFREMSIRYDGNVAICCNDWRGVYKVGNIKDGVKTIWDSEPFQVARRFLYNGERTFDPCKGCDALSYRPGLLPDAKGKLSLPSPSSDDIEFAKNASSGSSFTDPVLRPWEKS